MANTAIEYSEFMRVNCYPCEMKEITNDGTRLYRACDKNGVPKFIQDGFCLIAVVRGQAGTMANEGFVKKIA